MLRLPCWHLGSRLGLAGVTERGASPPAFRGTGGWALQNEDPVEVVRARGSEVWTPNARNGQ
jgi:hypothetical protein